MRFGVSRLTGSKLTPPPAGGAEIVVVGTKASSVTGETAQPPAPFRTAQ